MGKRKGRNARDANKSKLSEFQRILGPPTRHAEALCEGWLATAARGDSRIDRFIAESGKGPYPKWNQQAAVAGGADAGKLENRTGRGACWLESLAVASRPLQRRLAETKFSFDFARIISRL